MKNKIITLYIIFLGLSATAIAQPPFPVGTVCVNEQLLAKVGVLPAMYYCPTCKYYATEFYVVAHQDDWQLFMGYQAYNSVRSYSPYTSGANGSKVVFIYVTDGCYHISSSDPCSGILACAPNERNGWAGPRQCDGVNTSMGVTNHSYCLVRENAAMSSIHTAATQDAPDPYLPNSIITLNGHNLQVNRYKNTVSYFLRVSTYTMCRWFPGGNCGCECSDPDGHYCDRSQQGFINDGTCSLASQFENTAPSDKPVSCNWVNDWVMGLHAEYTDYNDFVKTMAAIYQFESNNGDAYPTTTPWINIQDPNTASHNYGDNSEHTGAGQAAWDAAVYYASTTGSTIPVNLWIDYYSQYMGQNLHDNVAVLNKSALFSSYVSEMLHNQSYYEWGGYYYAENSTYNRLYNTATAPDW